MVMGVPDLGGEGGEIAAALGGGWDVSVLVEGSGSTGSGQREEEHILLVAGEDFGDVGRGHDGGAEAIGLVGRLGEGLAAEGEVFGVEGSVAAVPEECAVGLIGFEVAEIAATASSEAASSAAESTTSEAAPTSTAGATAAWTLTALALSVEGLVELGVIAHSAEVDTGEGVGGAVLTGDGYGVARG